MKRMAKDERLSEFVAFQDLLILLPIKDNLLRSVSLAPDRWTKDTGELICCYNPLYVLHEGFYLNFCKTIKRVDPKTGSKYPTWHINDEELMVEAIQKEALPFLRLAPDANTFANKLPSLASPYMKLDENIICSLLKSKRFGEARLRLTLFSLRHIFYFGADELKAKMKMLSASLDKNESDKVLDAWTKESIENLELNGVEKYFE